MLSNNSSSSIQKRRQSHRRQQSLEVPILATPLPTHPRQQRPQHGHRRGLSVDQALSARHQPSGFRPLHPQQHLRPHSPLAGVTPNTNTGQNHPSSDTQHYVQETQQHLPSQPGHPAQDFQTHLQQQLQGLVNVNPQQIAYQNAEDAKMQLQQHINWFQATYGEPTPNITISTTLNPHSSHQAMGQAPMTPPQQPVTLPIHGMPISQGHITYANSPPTHHAHPHTVPNTPQNHPQPWSSPPQTHAKQVRSQSFQLDTAPMATTPTFDAQAGDFVLQPQQHFAPQGSFVQDNFAGFGSDQSYASSAYSSSIADATSPHPFNTPHMPTVPEEPDLPGFEGDNYQQSFMGGPDLLLDATAGAIDGSQDDQFFYHPQAMSPRTAALANLGDINASIEDTGISPEQVTQYMSEQDPESSKWTCLYPGCDKTFGRKENIRAHVQTHLGDRQFKCNDCGKCFVRQHDLKRHAKIHSGAKNHVCPCGMSFARQDALTRHRQRGMCFGVLPGFEKNEDERKKRGRPRKERPDLESRTEKATRARRMDAASSRQASSPPAQASEPPVPALEPPSSSAAPSDFLAASANPAGDPFAAYASGSAGSSDSGASDRSFPDTPVDSGASPADVYESFDLVQYVDPSALAAPSSSAAGAAMSSADDYSSGSSWRFDTPPTSPLTMGELDDAELRCGLTAFLDTI